MKCLNCKKDFEIMKPWGWCEACTAEGLKPKPIAHSPLPWHTTDTTEAFEILDVDGMPILIVDGASSELNAKNQDFVIRVCNAYPKVMAALNSGLSYALDQEVPGRPSKDVKQFQEVLRLLQPGV